MLRSTFAGFTTAQLGLRASQKALDVTGQNIANINTEGYTRQRVDIVSLNFEKGDIYSSDNNYRIGFGVEITGVSQIRDPFLDIQYRSQISKVGTNDAHDSTYKLLEDIFDESMTAGIRNSLSAIETALKKMASPSESGTQISDSSVRAAAQTLINLVHDNGTKLKGVKDDIIASLQGASDASDVKRANELLEKIAQLNTSIKNSEILGNGALELKDQRNMALDELASFLPIDVKYHDEELAANFSVEELTVSFKTTDGAGNPVTITLVDDGNYGKFSATVPDDGSAITVDFTEYGKTAPADTYKLSSRQLKDGTFKGTLDMLNEGGVFNGSTTNGIPFYEQAFDTFLTTFVTTMNRLNNDPDVVNSVTTPYDPEKPHDNDLFSKIDPSKPWSATNVKINEKWITGEVKVITSHKDNAGTDAQDNVLAMVDAMTGKTKFTYNAGADTFFTGSFNDCYINIESTLGTDSHSAETALDNYISVLNQTSNNRDSVSAVWLDEEVMNLMQYSKSYSASARLMTTLDEALDKLINGTGVVGR